MLSVTAPSFNTSREVLNEPATLRGLDPDQTLILINGIRYHNMVWLFQGALRGQLGRGSVGNDLNSVPFPAIEKIEILRDGAAAQYGSDAIAGVIDIHLKETVGKTSIQLHTGQFYKGDGEKFFFGINRGINLNKKGFLNFSGSYRYQAPTYRGGTYDGTVYKNYPSNLTQEDIVRVKTQDDSLVQARNFNRKNVLDNIGNSKTICKGFLLNGSYSINSQLEVFGTATINSRKIERKNAYRFPKDSGRINFGLFPDGFQPISKPTITDITVIAGIKVKTKNDWHWDFKSSYGSNTLKSFTSNTNNASQSFLGQNAPTSFYTGKDIYQQLTNEANFTKRYIKLPGHVKSLNLGWGAEWRLENYQTAVGDSASWYNYDQQNYSQGGVGGTAPENAVNKNRNVWATYLELEAESGKHFLFNAAGRYEYYSDFGGNLAGKLAARYKFSDRFSLRASVGNGFRAPSLQQRYLTSIQDSYKNSSIGRILIIRGTFPNDHAVTDSFGIPSLKAEKSINLGGGFTARFLKNFRITVDAYWIQIKNRIILSSLLDTSTLGVKEILKNIPGIRIDQVQFFTNAINTKTKGIDIIIDGEVKVGKANLGITLSANFTSTRLFGNIQSSSKLPEDRKDTLKLKGLFNIEERIKTEDGQPNNKIILALNYKQTKTQFVIRNTWYGKTSTANVFTNPSQVIRESFSPRIITDVSLTYSMKSWVSITAGVNNIFDTYPDELKNYENTNQGSWIYSPEASPFGFNGGYYFVSMSFNF
jgi:iron complex outermembrane receptor protein